MKKKILIICIIVLLLSSVIIVSSKTTLSDTKINGQKVYISHITDDNGMKYVCFYMSGGGIQRNPTLSCLRE